MTKTGVSLPIKYPDGIFLKVWCQKYSVNGDLPNLFASAIKEAGKPAVAELGNFMRQLDKRAPERTRGFESQVLAKLDTRQKATHFPEVFRNAPPRKPTPPDTTKPADGLGRGAISPEIKGWLDKSIKTSNPESIAGQGAPRNAPPRKPIPPGTTKPDGSFESSIDRGFRDGLFKDESRGKPNDGYGAHNPEGRGIGAWGRYQMRSPALQEAGLVDENNKWTGKYGVKSGDDFLNNPDAQERAFVSFMQTKYSRLEKSGALNKIGKRFVGKDGKDITISEAGLLAAAHRTGAGKVNKYLNYMRSNNWKSDFSGLKDEIAQSYGYIEKRLKTFQDKAVRKR